MGQEEQLWVTRRAAVDREEGYGSIGMERRGGGRHMSSSGIRCDGGGGRAGEGLALHIVQHKSGGAETNLILGWSLGGC